MTDSYTPDWFARFDEGTQSSANEIVPVVMGQLQPSSVLDVGCGSGAWLRAFSSLGVKDLIGVDGYSMSAGMRFEPPLQLITHELSHPLSLRRQFDLVLSLEVAEHIPDECADTFIDSLCRHASAVLFSAAIPGQGGVGHINERWQSYWAAKFAQRGYHPVDVVRSRIWDNELVEYWYRQNTLLYLTDPTRIDTTERMPLNVVHPLFCRRGSPSIRTSCGYLVLALRRRFGTTLRQFERARHST